MTDVCWWQFLCTFRLNGQYNLQHAYVRGHVTAISYLHKHNDCKGHPAPHRAGKLRCDIPVLHVSNIRYVLTFHISLPSAWRHHQPNSLTDVDGNTTAEQPACSLVVTGLDSTGLGYEPVTDSFESGN